MVALVVSMVGPSQRAHVYKRAYQILPQNTSLALEYVEREREREPKTD